MPRYKFCLFISYTGSFSGVFFVLKAEKGFHFHLACWKSAYTTCVPSETLHTKG